MLQLKNIIKDYPVSSDLTVHALKGISIDFRKSEFVSILGPSGCGKTTMLNIIGGLDHYTQGDLIINGTSTKSYKDRDWDSYRNHSVGFVFQSYNLIPHQTVLQNVEIALTLSGVSKSERRKRAIKALQDVGLGHELNKHPNEMSGGQMQRVAIARAIVNDPDIILADEPTGALDTETSLQVMDILQNIAKNRLVVMVTHNPDLAEKYSTRIIRMLDGVILSDSNPLTQEEYQRNAQQDDDEKNRKMVKKPSMSLWTSFMLSLKNLFTKKGRTALTSFAGSIGIIGIALIFAVSQGTTNYINSVQEETLSSYPLTIQSSHTDMGSLMRSFVSTAQSNGKHELDAVYEKMALYNLTNSLNNIETAENDLGSFKKHIDSQLKQEDSPLGEAISGVRYTYNLDLQILTKGKDENDNEVVMRSDTSLLMQSMIARFWNTDMSGIASTATSGSGVFSLLSGSSASSFSLWEELLSAKDGSVLNPILFQQYDVIEGRWPEEYNEVVLVVDSKNELDDITLYALGLKSEKEINEIIDAARNGTEIQGEQKHWSFQELMDKEYKIVPEYACYYFNPATGNYEDWRDNKEIGLETLYNGDSAVRLKVVGIIRPNETASSTMLSGSICYTYKLTQHIASLAETSELVKAQKDSPDVDVFNKLPFKNDTLSDGDKATFFAEYVATLSNKEKAEVMRNITVIKNTPDDDTVMQQATMALSQMDKETIYSLVAQKMGMSAETISAYVASGQITEQQLNALILQGYAEQIKQQYATQILASLSAYNDEQLSAMLDMSLGSYTNEEKTEYYNSCLSFSDSNYEDNLASLGVVDMAIPSSISLYASTFKSKDVIVAEIDNYNNSVEEYSRISYTDYIGILLSSITTIIDAISYVLIGFVSISLVVSSIMIGVITLISVQERTKEIGILRAIGASKANVSGMFNAETVIIGFTSGLLGVVVTYLLCIPINIILHVLTGLNNLSATLPVPVALILIVISMLLTLISGIIPSRSAAKKDPVVALRTE